MENNDQLLPGGFGPFSIWKGDGTYIPIECLQIVNDKKGRITGTFKKIQKELDAPQLTEDIDHEVVQPLKIENK